MGRFQRRLPIGAELVVEGKTPVGVHARVWAPAWRAAELVVDRPARRIVPLDPDPEPGYFSALVPELAAGATYWLRPAGSEVRYPDPASRFQPDGPFGPSEVVDPSRFSWTDSRWTGIEPHRHVLYELHVGTFTREGTFAAARERLPELAELGVTTVELLPVADFAGRFGWGYDGVNLFAPSRLYGRPEDLAGLVNRAHELGLAVVLDVVYNHLGPSGNFLFELSPGYRAERPAGEWGDLLNFDGPGAGPVREFCIANAVYWISEFHMDGLRIDAVQTMIDHSPRHVLIDIQRRSREAAAGRHIFITAEYEPQDGWVVRPVDEGGLGLDAMWNDDFHHSATVAATGIREGYYHDYRGTPQELVSALKRGFLYQGQMYPWQRNPRGSPVFDLVPGRFIVYLENHDQVANTALGRRFGRLTTPGRLRALTALMLLSPGIPLLFQGQEYGSIRPWHYFADHQGELAEAVRRGRANFLTQFASHRTPEAQAELFDPIDRATFVSSVLDHADRDLPGHRELWNLHRDLLALRKDDPAFTDQRPNALDGAVIGPEALALRHLGSDPSGQDDHLLLVNLGATLKLAGLAEPLLAPPARSSWRTTLSSEDPRYGGRGTPPVATRAGLWIPGHAAVLLTPVPGATLRVDHPRRPAGPRAADPDWDPELES
jgi:maltooligosyltrehalose trehalohydrolase